jgi:hypothetical protein
MLTRRLNALVDAELLERRRYSAHPPRDEYVLTARGRDFRPVIVALLAWGNKHFAPEGASVLLFDARTGLVADPVMVDRATGRPLEEPDYVYAAGPAAGTRTRAKFASIDREQAVPKPEPISAPDRRTPRKRSAK